VLVEAQDVDALDRLGADARAEAQRLHAVAGERLDVLEVLQSLPDDLEQRDHLLAPLEAHHRRERRCEDDVGRQDRLERT